jgi:hypothetical protein
MLESSVSTKAGLRMFTFLPTWGITAILVAVLDNQNRRVALPRQGIAVRPLSQRHERWCREGKGYVLQCVSSLIAMLTFSSHRIVGIVGMVQWVIVEDDNRRDGLQD